MLVWVEDFVGGDLAGGHLAAVECCAGVVGGEEDHYGIILAAVAVSTRDEDNEGAGALMPVLEVATFVGDRAMDHL